MINRTRALASWGGMLFALLTTTTNAAAQPPWTLTTIYQFRGAPSDGAEPIQIIGSGGVLYGATAHGGAAEIGTVYSLTPPASPGSPWIETVLHSFAGGSDGNGPSGVIMGSGGVLYGVTFRGGTYGYGTAFSLTPPASQGGAWSHEVLFNFNNRDDPSSSLVIGAGGVLYGTTRTGGAGQGAVYSLTPPASQGEDWTETVLHSFDITDGDQPEAGVVIGQGGVLYGSAQGGPSNEGVVFSLSPPTSPGGAWGYSILGSPGGDPAGGVAIGPGGVLFGTTSDGGTPRAGTVFSFAPPSVQGGQWTQTLLYTFTGLSDGSMPLSPLAVTQSGILYGVTPYGGNTDNGQNVGYGTVFSLIPPSLPGGPWTESVLHTFQDDGDGTFPNSLIVTKQGTLYGVAENSESGPSGSVFEVTP